MDAYSPSAYDQGYSSPAGSPYNPSGSAPPKPSGKPTGKGSRGPYKPRANKASQQATGSSVSPQRAPPKAKAAKKKRKEKSPSLGEDDDIDLDDLEETPQPMLSRDDDEEDDMNGRSGSRAGSRAGTPMGGSSTRQGLQAAREGTAGVGEPAAEEEEEPEDEDDEEKAAAAAEARIVNERIKEVKDAQMLLVGHLDPEQQKRFDSWKTSTFAKAQVRKLIIATTGNSITEDLAQIVGGVSKVYVGLIVKKAREVQFAHNHTGPLQPFHLREAHRLYVRESRSTKRPGAGLTKKALFVR